MSGVRPCKLPNPLNAVIHWPGERRIMRGVGQKTSRSTSVEVEALRSTAPKTAEKDDDTQLDLLIRCPPISEYLKVKVIEEVSRGRRRDASEMWDASGERRPRLGLGGSAFVGIDSSSETRRRYTLPVGMP